MKRTRFPLRHKAPRDNDQLVRLATGLGLSGSRVEDAYWESRLADAVLRMLRAGDDAGLESALDRLYEAEPRAYDGLADTIESRAESGTVLRESGPLDVVLFAAPVLAWSRYSIPSGSIPKAALAMLRTQLQAHVFAAGTRLALADVMFSPDQLPRGYGKTFDLAETLWEAAADDRDLPVDPRRLPQTNHFLSDVRYVLGAVAAPKGEAVFRWQEEDGSREAALAQWRAQGGPALQPLLPGCAFEALLPDAYHAAWRMADRDARPFSLRASVAFLESTLGAAPATLRAVIAPFHDQRLEEYRVGLTRTDSSDVLYGVVWALMGAEDDSADTVAEIEAVLRQCGVDDILNLDNRFPLEYCDDCGAPLFPNPEGESTHAEMPENAEPAPSHLH